MLTWTHQHTNLVHPASPDPSSKPSARRLSMEFGAEAHVTTMYPRGFRCDVCHEACLSQMELDVHVVTVHSCPICHDGTYMDMRELEEHLEQHRSPYACNSCGLAYAEEDQLLEHYKDSPSDIHPHCEKCHLGFENNDMYTDVCVLLVKGDSEMTVGICSISMKSTHASLVMYAMANFLTQKNSLFTIQVRGNIPSARNVTLDSETNSITRT